MSGLRLALFALTGLVVGATMLACSDDSVAPPEPTTVTVTPSAVELAALESIEQLNAEIRDQHGQIMNVPWTVWSSGDAEIARVDSAGLVTAVGNGATTVTATVGRISGSAPVTVAQKVRSVAVSPGADTVVIGDTLRLVAAAADENGHAIDGAQFVWTSANPQVAVVDNSGLVTAIGDGDVEVAATSSEVTGRATLTIEEPAPAAVSVTPDSVEFKALGRTADLTVEVFDQGGNVMVDVAVKWSSGDTTVVAVNSAGQVTAVGPGAANVAARAGGVSGEAVVVVRQVVQSVVVSPGEASLGIGDTLRLAGIGLDENDHAVAGAALAWSSSDASIATVWSGLVTGVGEGAATVTARLGNLRGSAEITVDNPDRAALAALYNATDGPSWVNSENWLTEAPLREWYGVGTDVRGRVVRLNLNGSWDREAGQWVSHGLSGPIPSELEGLGRLEGLYLANNDLTGPIPPELENLSNLKVLNLSGNKLTGAIPPELRSLTKLEGLYLANNDLTGSISPELGSLSNLEGLNLGGNDLAGSVPPNLARLTSLRYLNLYANKLTGSVPPELGNLSNLQGLSLHDNDLTGPIPPELGRLTSLRSLELNANKLTGPIPPELGNLASLEGLNLHDNDLTGQIPPALGSLASLQWLFLSLNSGLAGPIPRTFLNLQRLRSFGATGSSLCVPGTAEFVEWVDGPGTTSHRSVGVPFCNKADKAALENFHDVTGGGDWSISVGWLGGSALESWHGVRTDSLGRVTALHLSNNKLSGVLPSDIGALSQLASLRVDGNALAGRLPQSLSGLDLEELHYGGTELCAPAEAGFGTWLAGIKSHNGTDVQCPPLSDRDALAALHAATGGSEWRENQNWLSDAPLGSWHGVAVNDRGRVVRLELSNNGLSGPIPPELSGLADLQWLILNWNRLTGPIPPELGDLANLQLLYLSGNDLSGWIPPELAELSDLRYLHLDSNALMGTVPRELGRLAKLQRLRLDWNELSGQIPPELGGLSNLETLGLARNDLSGAIPRELGDLGGLRSLYLGNNNLSGPIPWELGGLAHLRWINLAGNGHTGPLPAQLGSLTALEVLLLAENSLSGPIPAAFGALTALRQLDLSHNTAMAGPLPRGMTATAGMEELLTTGTDLCAPSDADFQNWLRGLRKLWVPSCSELPAAYLVQAVQSRSSPVPLVEGERALLRVFPTARKETAQGIPPIRARFYVDGRQIHVENIPGKSAPIPTRVDEGSLRSSAAAEIAGRWIRSRLEMVIEIDPDGTLDPGLGVARRIPADGRMSVDVRRVPTLDLTLIPFLWTGSADSSIVPLVSAMAADPGRHEMLADVRTLLPVRDIGARAHEPVASTSNRFWDLLSQTEMIRVMEGGKGFYKGMMTPVNRATSGVAYQPGRSSFSPPQAHILAQELGHNMSLGHAPCGTSWGLDAAFPNRNGSTGAWGYDLRGGRLVRPSTPDLMSYCGPKWISDYHFNNALRFRLSDHRHAGTQAAASPARSLLLWGGVDPDGQPFLNPAFVVDAPPELPDSTGDYAVAGRSADGRELFSLSFTMPELASEEDFGSSFVFALPVRPEWADALAAITLSGPERSVTLTADSDLPMAILRDPRTGMVRGFLRDVADPATVQADAVAGASGTRLDILFSRGLPARTAWQP